MSMLVRCPARRADGQPCRMAPLLESTHCWAHEPANAEAAAEARRMGGLRRRREGTVAGAYEFEGLTTVASIRRLLEIAGVDALALDNSVPRIRALVAVALAASKMLETGELEQRLTTLEASVLGRTRAWSDSPFESDGAALADFGDEGDPQP